MRFIDPEVWKLDLLLFHGCNEKTAWIIDRINHAPTVDAVPVIRCKNCAYWDEHELDLSDYDEDMREQLDPECRPCLIFDCCFTGPKDYCSFARRKNDE